ncbi:replication endonuclease [Escherichia coli]|uniref:replication endonuclease n=1 Tax=Escherichia coli TaxID=562 RepID=UPI0032B48203
MSHADMNNCSGFNEAAAAFSWNSPKKAINPYLDPAEVAPVSALSNLITLYAADNEQEQLRREALSDQVWERYFFNESRDPVQREMEQDKLISRAKLAHEQQRFNPDMVILADVNAQPSHISKPLMQRIEYFSSLGRPKAYSRYLRETIKPCLERLEHVRESQLSTSFRFMASHEGLDGLLILPEMSQDQVKRLSTLVAAHMSMCLDAACGDLYATDDVKPEEIRKTWEKVAAETLRLDVIPPAFEQLRRKRNRRKPVPYELIPGSLARMLCADWWYRKLWKMRCEWREEQLRAVCLVSKKASPYVSYEAVMHKREQRRKSLEFFRSHELVNEDGDTLDMEDVVSGLLGALLSPIGLVVTALAGVALVVWKYWQPITAFLGGVVEGFKAAAGPISAAFEPLKPVFQWIGDKVQALWGWFTDLLTPVKSTSAELQSAAAMGRRFGEALAEGLNMVMHPLDSLKSSVSWLLEKLGIVSKEAAKAKLPERVTRQQPATVNADGKVMMPSGGFPSWGYGFAGMYDSGGYIPRGQFGIVGENGPEIVNGPANVTSRRNTAALAAVVAGMMGVAAAPAELPPLHPLALPAKGGEAMVSRAATVPPVHRIEAPTQIIIQTQPGQSAQDIAREVARQLDERERRLKAKARSNYSDQGGYDA